MIVWETQVRLIAFRGRVCGRDFGNRDFQREAFQRFKSRDEIFREMCLPSVDLVSEVDSYIVVAQLVSQVES